MTCDLCFHRKLRTVKFCLTCALLFCETHVREQLHCRNISTQLLLTEPARDISEGSVTFRRYSTYYCINKLTTIHSICLINHFMSWPFTFAPWRRSWTFSFENHIDSFYRMNRNIPWECPSVKILIQARPAGELLTGTFGFIWEEICWAAEKRPWCLFSHVWCLKKEKTKVNRRLLNLRKRLQC